MTSRRAPRAAAARVFVSVQVLRGVAAMLVVVNHLLDLTHDRLGAGQTGFQLGNAGVDIFFCISGFIMVVTTAKRWGEAGFWKVFLLRRFVRIFPLYWLLTVFKIVLTLAAPSMALHKGVSIWYYTASLLLIPAWDPSHQSTHPLLPVGWTLSFEIVFYMLFAVGIARSKRPLLGISLALVVLSGLGLLRRDSWPPFGTLLDPILLEFILGMGLGYITVAKWKLPVWVGVLALPVAGVLYAVSTQVDVTFTRCLFWGVPGFLIILSALSLESRIHERLAGFPKLAGDASYSIYLSHGFFLVPVGVVMAHSHLHGAVLWWGAGVVGMAVSLFGGIAVFKFVETPLTGLVKRVVEG